MINKFKESVKDFSDSVKSKVAEKEITEESLDPLLEKFRMQLLQNNVSLEACESIEEQLRSDLIGQEVRRGKLEQKVESSIKEVLIELLDDSFKLEESLEKSSEPPVIFLMGFNGSGKTTTTAKLAKLLKDREKDVVLGAGDTFRAASIEQLEEHGNKLDLKVISHEYEADPAAVAYDTVEHAKNEDKIALIDTAGRSHADENLMGELKKMVDVNDPDISFLVVDALSGNDVLDQAEAYEGYFDAIIVTKMDVDDNGGAIISISQKSGKPVAFIGSGQGYEDLEKFDKEEFVKEILE